MSDPAENFVDYVTKRSQQQKDKHGRTRLPAFLYDHVGPCPQVSRDHPFGQAAVVLNVPEKEHNDWLKYVYAYYFRNMGPYWIKSLRFAAERWKETGGAGYGPVEDSEFEKLMAEGLYSKFLCRELDEVDRERFGDLITDEKTYQYWKSDYSCMAVVKKTLRNVHIAPTVVLLRRQGERGGFSVVAIALARLVEQENGDADYEWLPEAIRPGDGVAWALAKYFALQGAIHRINLIDHTRVHFPNDAINAITKTVLPKRHIVFQLLEPHFWLTLPVNYAVLEGEKSLINRKTRQIYSPFAAGGREIRKLFPFGWYGAGYYQAKGNSAFRPYAFDMSPPEIPSHYGNYLRAYYEPIYRFVHAVLDSEMPLLDDDENSEWLEIQRWAEQISTWIPGFPFWRDFICPDSASRARSLEILARTVTAIIHNASVVHSADHAALHQMMSSSNPVPFILRTEPPDSRNFVRKLTQRKEERLGGLGEELKEALRSIEMPDLSSIVGGSAVQESLDLDKLREIANDVAALAAAQLFESRLRAPLCGKRDLRAARYADLLFYLPNNSSLLIECNYRFNKKTHRLRPLVQKFQTDLREVSEAVQNIVRLYNLPLLEPPTQLSAPDQEKQRKVVYRTGCIAASIQY